MCTFLELFGSILDNSELFWETFGFYMKFVRFWEPGEQFGIPFCALLAIYGNLLLQSGTVFVVMFLNVLSRTSSGEANVRPVQLILCQKEISHVTEIYDW